MNQIKAKQGHLYELRGVKVLAMTTGSRVTVAEIDEARAYPLGQNWIVDAADLEPLPMRYYFMEVPA